MRSGIVIGIDGGGTHTRALAADLSGHALAAAQAGAASPNKSAHARENVQQVIRDVVAAAGRDLGDVAALVAGIAGLDSPEDQRWAEEFTAVPGLARSCSRVQVNDALVAHAGALASRPGIIAVSGTGSIILGVTESGAHVRNYDFHHYAHTAARHLAFDAVHRVLAGRVDPRSQPLVADILAFWDVPDVAALCRLGAQGFVADRFACIQRFGELAPMITTAAADGVPLAVAVCDQVASTLATGIALVGACFERDAVDVALIGGVARSRYIHDAVARELERHPSGRYRVVTPRLSGPAGAVLMALRQAGIDTTDETEQNLLTSTAGHDVH